MAETEWTAVTKAECSEVASLLKKLEAHIEWHGPAHTYLDGDIECPEDDTCVCGGGAINEGINEVHRFLSSLATLPRTQTSAEPVAGEGATAGRDRHVLTNLSNWLCDEREKVSPSSMRWQSLADVSDAKLRFEYEYDEALRLATPELEVWLLYQWSEDRRTLGAARAVCESREAAESEMAAIMADHPDLERADFVLEVQRLRRKLRAEREKGSD